MTRAELIAQCLCIACQRNPAAKDAIYCKRCLRVIYSADAQAMKGLRAEVKGVREK